MTFSEGQNSVAVQPVVIPSSLKPVISPANGCSLFTSKNFKDILMSKNGESKPSSFLNFLPETVTSDGKPEIMPFILTVFTLPDSFRSATFASVNHMNPNFEPTRLGSIFFTHSLNGFLAGPEMEKKSSTDNK